MKFAALAVAVAANKYDFMGEDDLLVSFESTLSTALSSEARGDADAAVAKTAAIKNIQKALTARILKRLDEGHRGHAAPDQRYGAPPRYHAVCRARPRERHQDPPEGRRCPRHGQEVSCVRSIRPGLTLKRPSQADARIAVVRRPTNRVLSVMKASNQERRS